LPESSIPALIMGFGSISPDAFADIPGITQVIIAAADSARKQAYIESFRAIWITAAVLASTGLIGNLENCTSSDYAG
jgi:hypothetical protein